LRLRVVSAGVLALLVAACATNRSFTVNDEQRTLSAAETLRSRQNWSARTFRVLSDSRADTEARLFALDTIANALKTGVGSIAPCTELDLAVIRVDSLSSVKATSPGGVAVVYEPRSFSERWGIYACGKPMRWRVLDRGQDIVVFHY
jgi:hypothetical protein